MNVEYKKQDFNDTTTKVGNCKNYNNVFKWRGGNLGKSINTQIKQK